MKILVIPDIHLKTWIFDRAEDILRAGKAEKAICLMDMPDDWDMEFRVERYKETFDRAITFAKDYSDTGKYEKIEVPGKLKYKAFIETVTENAEYSTKNGLSKDTH